MVDVVSFALDDQALEKVLIVYAELKYNCQYNKKVYILMFRNDLSVPRMDNNLILPLIIREAGLVVNGTPKINSMDPSVEHHSLYFPNFNIHITLFLNDVFSYFSMSKL